MLNTPNLNFNKPELVDSPPDITVMNGNWDTIDKHLNNAIKYQKAGGTATAITLSDVSLVDGFAMKFIVTAANNSAATTLNGKKVFKPGTTTAPKLVVGRPAEVYYDATGDGGSGCFFTKASAGEGNAVAANVLAGKTFSNDDDSGIVGTMINRAEVYITPGVTGKSIPQGYHSGGGSVLGDANLVPANIKSGITIHGVSGNSDVVSTADGTLTDPLDIRSGKIAYSKGSKVIGTMPEKAAATITPTTTAQTIAAGQYLTGIQTIKGDANLVAGNIKAGQTIFGIAGKASVVDTASSDATAAQILAGKKAHVNGAQLTGTMIDRDRAWHDSILTHSYGSGIYAVPPAGYYAGSTDYTVRGGVRVPEANLLPANILSGKSIFGVAGTAIAGKRFATGSKVPVTSQQSYSWQYASGSVAGLQPYIEVTGLGFKPAVIIAFAKTYNSTEGDVSNMVLYMAASDGVITDSVKLSTFTTTTRYNNYTMNYKGNTLGGYVNTTGFRIPTHAVTGDTSYTWLAWE